MSLVRHGQLSFGDANDTPVSASSSWTGAGNLTGGLYIPTGSAAAAPAVSSPAIRIATDGNGFLQVFDGSAWKNMAPPTSWLFTWLPTDQVIQKWALTSVFSWSTTTISNGSDIGLSSDGRNIINLSGRTITVHVCAVFVLDVTTWSDNFSNVLLWLYNGAGSPTSRSDQTTRTGARNTQFMDVVFNMDPTGSGSLFYIEASVGSSQQADTTALANISTLFVEIVE